MEDLSIRKHIKGVLDNYFNASLFSDNVRLAIATEILNELKSNQCLNSKMVSTDHLKNQSISSVQQKIADNQKSIAEKQAKDADKKSNSPLTEEAKQAIANVADSVKEKMVKSAPTPVKTGPKVDQKRKTPMDYKKEAEKKKNTPAKKVSPKSKKSTSKPKTRQKPKFTDKVAKNKPVRKGAFDKLKK